MLRKLPAVVLAIVLLLLPLAARWFYFYEGRYEPAEVPRPDLAAIEVPTPEQGVFADRYASSTPGAVVVDRAHGNRFEMGELNVLQARLAARGQRIEPLQTAEDLAGQLQYARALVIISPGKDWTPSEIRQVQDFVDKGGRLLLVTDPTRFDVILDEFGAFAGLDHDVIHVNDLAARFGLVFQPDYLYNTVENEGNFRNIKLTDLAADELTGGLDQIVFYAAHSIVSEERALIAAGGETRSSNSERAAELAVAVSAADGAVLALGDLTFMTEPYNAVYDNDRLVANVADFLSGAQRRYELADFPFFFDDQVDLIYAGDPLLDSDFLAGGGALQDLFADVGKALILREAEDDAADTLFVGLYEETEEVEPYLAVAEVTVVITPTQQAPGETGAVVEEEGAPEPTPSPGEPLTITAGVTLTGGITVTPGVAAAPEITATAEVSPAAEGRIQIEALGEVALDGTSLLVLQTDGQRQVLVVLADTEKGLQGAIERLSKGDLEGCLLQQTETTDSIVLALCPTGEVESGEGIGGWQEPEPKPPSPGPAGTATPEPGPQPAETPQPAGEPEGRVFVIAVDEGKGRYDSLTSAADYAAVLGTRYEVKTWSLARDGLPELADLADQDLVIWTAGDYEDAFGSAESDLFLTLMLQGMPMMLSGAYVGDPDVKAVQRDLKVNDATHPIAQGFGQDEVIALVPAPSGREYETGVHDDIGEEEGSIVLVRGPGSEASGVPSLFVLEDEFSEVQVVFAGFPLYLLPEEAKAQLVLNTVGWLLAP